jgi:TnpA family transposase
MLRIFATLGLKKNTQSSIVKKLSSYKSNDTLRALIELDKIIMTLYILDYIDDEGFCRICKWNWSRIGKSQILGVMRPSTF